MLLPLGALSHIANSRGVTLYEYTKAAARISKNKLALVTLILKFQIMYFDKVYNRQYTAANSALISDIFFTQDDLFVVHYNV